MSFKSTYWLQYLLEKSGPGIICNNSSVVILLLSIYAITASTTSPRLCVGMLVAIPTAIPSAPLTKIFGTLTGRTDGSFSVSSKFNYKINYILIQICQIYILCKFLKFCLCVTALPQHRHPQLNQKFP